MGNYEYDEIGNLVKDKIAGVVDIQWTPYGKVRQVTKADSSKVCFRYDGAGNRVEKKVTRNDSTFITHYLRDASGNVMAVYNDSSLIEQPIYSSSRLGQYLGQTSTGKRTLGHKNYELTNHLGNVLTVVTDNISMSTIDTIRATVASASDYYPFGLQMPGRTVSDTVGYRYGFNGKEWDPDSEWGQTSYDYGFRIYNPGIAKFLSVDPLTKNILC